MPDLGKRHRHMVGNPVFGQHPEGEVLGAAPLDLPEDRTPAASAYSTRHQDQAITLLVEFEVG